MHCLPAYRLKAQADGPQPPALPTHRELEAREEAAGRSLQPPGVPPTGRPPATNPGMGGHTQLCVGGTAPERSYRGTSRGQVGRPCEMPNPSPMVHYLLSLSPPRPPQAPAPPPRPPEGGAGEGPLKEGRPMSAHPEDVMWGCCEQAPSR
ncbi:hypothetical protein GWK47_033643 [Chionoecetes opilio]|uniref:Uncharacterized protein n=1 Tax=Chionoecetes opilio TaxID=41210 RepID=A0A8J4YPK1_CHIOP|nr:hypothetical protein GWK47_033643 [Chionoecetes opilio]